MSTYTLKEGHRYPAATGRAGETYRQLAEGPMTRAALFPRREVDECEVLKTVVGPPGRQISPPSRSLREASRSILASWPCS